MEKIPFTSYDFWAYLSAGSLLLFAVDQALGTALLARDSWTVVQAVVAVTFAYAMGQLIASMSSLLLERLLVGKLLGYPRNVLFGQPLAWKWFRRLMPLLFPFARSDSKSSARKSEQVTNVPSPSIATFRWLKPPP